MPLSNGINVLGVTEKCCRFPAAAYGFTNLRACAPRWGCPTLSAPVNFGLAAQAIVFSEPLSELHMSSTRLRALVQFRVESHALRI